MARNKKKIIDLLDDELLITKTYSFRYYPRGLEELQYVAQHGGHKRFVYNYFANLQLERLEKNLPFLSNDEMDKVLTSLKKDHLFLKDVNSQMLQ